MKIQENVPVPWLNRLSYDGRVPTVDEGTTLGADGALDSAIGVVVGVVRRWE